MECGNGFLVSVIIPVYNVLPYLHEALDSVLRQTYTDLEILIIDDGSTDGSGAICDAYAEKDGRIRVLHQDNRGLSCARNAGLDVLTGDAVAFLDSDDAFQPECIETMVSAMIREGTDMVTCRSSVHESTGKMHLTGREKTEPSLPGGVYDRVCALRALARGKLNNYAWNKLYRKELWNGFRYPVGHVYEDVDTTYRILLRCERICVLDAVLVQHRIRQGSITNTVSWDNARDWIRAYFHFDAFLEKNVPEIISKDELMRLRLTRVNRMIWLYVGLPTGEEREDCEWDEALRQRIITQGTECGISHAGFRTRVAYRMLCLCPRLLKVSVLFYIPIRRFTARISEKICRK